MVRVSVVIPVYNVEKYLENCLNSIISQTFKDIEIICVNDGSTDNSLSILKRFAQNDNRIKIIDKKNEGVSVARNIGIINSTAEYIQFVDSDDVLTPDCIELCVNEFQNTNADVVNFKHRQLLDYKEQKEFCWKPLNDYISKSSKEINKLSFLDFFYFSVFVWDKMYSREFLLANEIKFNASLSNFEDVVFNIEALFYCQNFVLIDKYLYSHNSFSENFNKKCIDINIPYKIITAFIAFINGEHFKKVSAGLQCKSIDAFIFTLFKYKPTFKTFDVENIKPTKDLIHCLEKNVSQNVLRKSLYFKKLKNSNNFINTMKIRISQIFLRSRKDG